MARGWGSKDVESQRESRDQAAKAAVARSAKNDLQQKRDALQLQRARIQRELQTACNERFRGQLEASLKHLDAELERLDGGITAAGA